MTTMSHRERVLTALNHQEPDRIPIDVGATGVTQIHGEAYVRLLHHLGWVEEAEKIEEAEKVKKGRGSSMATLSQKFLDFLDVDCRGIDLGAPEKTPQVFLDKNRYVDEWGVVWIRAEGGEFINQEGPFQKKAPTSRDFERHAWPDPDDDGRYRGFKERAQKVRQETDYALVFNFPYGLVRECQRTRGFGEWLEDLLVNPALAEALMEKVLEVVTGIAKRALEEAGPYMDVVLFYDDMGFQDRCYMRPELYRRLVKPYHSKLVETLKSQTSAKVMMHSDGAIREILWDLIDIGVEIINPVQTTAKGMDSRSLKAEFGQHLSFWGAIDTQWALPFGTPDQVREEVRKRLQDLAPGGGYIVGSCHNIQAEVPPKNILAMIEAAKEYGVSRKRH